jgi:hypothetical protein
VHCVPAASASSSSSLQLLAWLDLVLAPSRLIATWLIRLSRGSIIVVRRNACGIRTSAYVIKPRPTTAIPQIHEKFMISVSCAKSVMISPMMKRGMGTR